MNLRKSETIPPEKMNGLIEVEDVDF